MPRPAFVSLDGLDGTGKSTQCRLLVEWLTAQRVPVTACTDPGGTALGQELRRILLFGREHRIGTTTEAMLFMASRAQLVEEVIRPALDRGEVVVFDLPPEVAVARRNREADRMEARGEDFFARVRTGFVYEAGMRPGKHRII